MSLDIENTTKDIEIKRWTNKNSVFGIYDIIGTKMSLERYNSRFELAEGRNSMNDKRFNCDYPVWEMEWKRTQKNSTEDFF